MGLTKEEQVWIEKCIKNPERYRIDVDNDDIHVSDIEQEESIFSFNEYGYYFIVNILRHLGCNADLV